jgi:branched-chain amino acid transport system ATP-binding protein
MRIWPWALPWCRKGASCFRRLSVEENLLIGAYGRKTGGYWTLETVYDLFPILKERRNNPGTALSGGQQQMVAIGRALMSNPRCCCATRSPRSGAGGHQGHLQGGAEDPEAGASLIVVEQDIGQAMQVADRVYCMMEGR